MSSTQDFKEFDFSKLILGAAQFGSDYGVSNLIGETTKNEVNKILTIAEKNNIKLIDTSAEYRNSETKIGKANLKKISAITKLSPLPDHINEKQISNWALSCVESSSKKLKVKKIHTLLIHKVSDLRGKRGEILYKSLIDLKKDKKIINIGYSVYSTSEIRSIYKNHKPDVIQIPMNILDNRFNSSGWNNRLREEGVHVHARSIFFQGLLLMKSSERPKYFNKWAEFWKIWDRFIKEKKLSPLSVCLRFILKQIIDENISHFIVGINESNHLEEIIREIKATNILDINSFDLSDEDLLNPHLWKIK